MSKLCPTCHAFIWGAHRCPAAWEVWLVGEDRADAYTVNASDESQAAEEWASHKDSYTAEYSIVGGRDAMVYIVRQGTDDQPMKFKVSGETVVVYNAREVKP